MEYHVAQSMEYHVRNESVSVTMYVCKINFAMPLCIDMT